MEEDVSSLYVVGAMCEKSSPKVTWSAAAAATFLSYISFPKPTKVINKWFWQTHLHNSNSTEEEGFRNVSLKLNIEFLIGQEPYWPAYVAAISNKYYKRSSIQYEWLLRSSLLWCWSISREHGFSSGLRNLWHLPSEPELQVWCHWIVATDGWSFEFRHRSTASWTVGNTISGVTASLKNCRVSSSYSRFPLAKTKEINIRYSCCIFKKCLKLVWAGLGNVI